MTDRLFFPLALFIAATLVFLALQPFAERPPTGPLSGGGRNAEDVLASGEELHRFLPGETGGLTIEPGSAGEGVLLRINRLAEQTYDDPRSGPHLVLAEDLEYAFENREVEVAIEARAAGEFGASQFEAAYIARAGEESGWRTFSLTTEFAPYAFTWSVPPRGDSEGYDFIGVRPLAPDKRRSMEIRSIRIRTVGAKGETAPAAQD
jgi:hypothetical protein